MSHRYLPGVPCWVELIGPAPDEATAFYAGLFGWDFQREDGGGGAAYRRATLGGRDVAGLADADVGTAESRWRTYVWTDDLDAVAERVGAAGGSVGSPPAEVAGLAQAATFADPAGAEFGAWQPTDHGGAERVNEPNTWNFTTVRTPEPAPAQTFYAAVFGWRAVVVDLWGVSATMWCLPGYGSFIDQHNPGWKAGHEQGGSPPGFVDAVGWLAELDQDRASGNRAGPPEAHWTVEFTVSDARRCAERCRALGGSVEVEPFDAGGTWSAVLRDPHGARFSINDFGSSE